jgi:two-component system, response regulator / RNA-binding antiterminator
LVIDEDPSSAAIIEAGLRAYGHIKVTVVRNLDGIARRISDHGPDAIMVSLQKPGRGMLDNLLQISCAVNLPVAMFVEQADNAMMEAAIEAGISAYVVNGLAPDRIKPILDLAISRFNATARIARELADAKAELENRKIIDHAKSLMMASRKIDEATAYALLRSTAMNQNCTIAEVAKSLVLAAGLLDL